MSQVRATLRWCRFPEPGPHQRLLELRGDGGVKVAFFDRDRGDGMAWRGGGGVVPSPTIAATNARCSGGQLWSGWGVHAEPKRGTLRRWTRAFACW